MFPVYLGMHKQTHLLLFCWTAGGSAQSRLWTGEILISENYFVTVGVTLLATAGYFFKISIKLVWHQQKINTKNNIPITCRLWPTFACKWLMCKFRLQNQYWSMFCARYWCTVTLTSRDRSDPGMSHGSEPVLKYKRSRGNEC